MKQLRKIPFQIVTTVHKDVTDRLMQINPTLAKQARRVLDVNKSSAYIKNTTTEVTAFCSRAFHKDVCVIVMGRLQNTEA